MIHRRLVLCEGRQDRAFLAGLLQDCWKLKPRASDPLGGKPFIGAYTYTTRNGAFLCLHEVDGKAKVRRALAAVQVEHDTKPWTRVDVIVDDDGEPNDPEWLVWRSDHAAVGVPKKQELERLLCAAFCRVDPQRGTAVAAFLESPPEGRVDGHAFALPYLARWTPIGQHRDLYDYSAIWHDGPLSDAVVAELRASGIYDTLRTLCGVAEGQ